MTVNTKPLVQFFLVSSISAIIVSPVLVSRAANDAPNPEELKAATT
jgi:hypothetical protein